MIWEGNFKNMLALIVPNELLHINAAIYHKHLV